MPSQSSRDSSQTSPPPRVPSFRSAELAVLRERQTSVRMLKEEGGAGDDGSGAGEVEGKGR
jgi:hypothetical protein